jgi:N-methylhydantoinase A
VTGETLARLARDFHEAHRTTYGHASAEEPVQIVNLRVTAIGRLARLDLTRAVVAAGRMPAPAGGREAHFAETGLVRCDVLARETLVEGTSRRGPLIVEGVDATIVVPPRWGLRVARGGFVILEATEHA